MALSTRAERIHESATLRVARRALELKAQGVEIVSLGAGEPDFRSPRVAEEAAIQALRDGFTRYTAAAGLPELREALAAHYASRHHAPWTAAEVVVTVGAKAALFELALALFGRGQEVLVPSPFWVSYPEQIRFCGATPVSVPTLASDNFRVDPEAVVERINESTRAVLLNSPSNPTGGLIGEEELEAIVSACAERGVLVIADETYERFVYDGGRFSSTAALASRYPDTVVLVGSFSKTYAMTGWRVGYLLGPSEIVRAVIAIQSHATSNPTSFAMKGALAALEGAEPDVVEMIAEYGARRELVMEELSAMPGISCLPPQGAFYAFPQVNALFREGVGGSVEFAEYLLERARVAVVPGAAFGADDHVRISFACSRRDLTEGLGRIRGAVEEFATVI